MHFKNRAEAGEKLVPELIKYKDDPNAVILALPRGGVVVAEPIAKTLNLPIDLVIPRKIGAPLNPEYAIGAITEYGDQQFNEDELKSVNKDWLDKAIKDEVEEAKRRREVYLKNRQQIDLKDKNVIVIDDGIATGMTMEVAIKSIKGQKPAKIIIAVPNCSKDSQAELEKQVDEFISLTTPAIYFAVGQFYDEFPQTSDQEVTGILDKF